MSATTHRLSDDGPDLSADEDPESLSKDKIFHILQTQRRRDALRYLKANEGPVEMRDLAEQVAAWENDTTVQTLGSDERQRVYIALYQSHLPKLDQEGIIDYNQSRGIVERGPLADQFDSYLETKDDTATAETEAGPASDDERWFRYYRWATAASAGTLAATWLNVPPAGLVANHVLGALVVAVYVFISAGQFALQ